MKDGQKKVMRLMNELRGYIDQENNSDQGILCPTCKGLRIYEVKESDDRLYLKTCNKCHTGFVYECEFCGKLNSTDSCNCKGYHSKIIEERDAMERELLENKLANGNIVSVYDYDGFVCINDKYIMAEDLEDELSWMLEEGYDINRYQYGSHEDKNFVSIDIAEVACEKMEDGYEDMDDYFDFKSDKLIKAQKLVDEWLDENSGANTVIYEDSNIVVDIQPMLDNIKSK